MFVLGSRLLFAAWRQTGRLAVSCVSIPRVEIAIRAFSRCCSVVGRGGNAELVCAAIRFLLRGFAFGSRLSFFLCQEKRDGLRYAAFLFRAGRDRHLCVLAVLVRLSSLAGSLRVCAFICGDLDGLPGTRGTREQGYGAGGAAFVRLYAAALAL